MKESQKIARYEIIRKLGKGGMGEVYLARDPNFVERQVAVKVLSDQLRADSGFRARFEREANTLADLEHPAIVPVYDFGEEDSQLYLVMRYMRGGSLAAYLPMPLHQVDYTLTRLAAALDKLHEKGIVHRDIKPANVLLDEDGVPYLADFGIARKVGKATTAVGTPRYMAPEQLRGKEIDPRTDVYQLGVMLFEMLTGHLPKPNKPSVRDYDLTLPTGCDLVIARATALKKEDRYQSAGELAQDFSAVVAGREDSSSPVGPSTAAPSWEDKTTNPRQLPNSDSTKRATPLVESIPTGEGAWWLGQKSTILMGMFGVVAVGVLIVLFIVMTALLEPDPSEKLGTIVKFTPEVKIEQENGLILVEGRGADLHLGQSVHTYTDAEATIILYCEQTIELPLGPRRNMPVDCEEAKKEPHKIVDALDPTLLRDLNKFPDTLASTRTSRGTENQKPLLISPRSVITDRLPTFRWQPVAGASGYRVTLTFSDPDRESWEVETTESSLSYPASQPALPLGSKISLKVATLDDVNQVDRSTFSILDEQSLAELAEAEAEIRRLEVDETAHAYLLAQLYRQQEMKNAAITQLEQITANPESVSADLWQQLGDLYFDIKLYAQAEDTYQSALNAAETSANQRAQANAYVGLALSADAFNESEEALDYLNQAEALYREIDQDALADQVVELRTEINP